MSLYLNVLVMWFESISIRSVCEVTVLKSTNQTMFNVSNVIHNFSSFVARVASTVLLTVTDMITKHVLIAQKSIRQTISLSEKWLQHLYYKFYREFTEKLNGVALSCAIVQMYKFSFGTALWALLLWQRHLDVVDMSILHMSAFFQ